MPLSPCSPHTLRMHVPIIAYTALYDIPSFSQHLKQGLRALQKWEGFHFDDEDRCSHFHPGEHLVSQMPLVGITVVTVKAAECRKMWLPKKLFWLQQWKCNAKVIKKWEGNSRLLLSYRITSYGKGRWIKIADQSFVWVRRRKLFSFLPNPAGWAYSCWISGGFITHGGNKTSALSLVFLLAYNLLKYGEFGFN